MKLSGYDSNSSRLRILLPAVLFPAPDRPSSTRRNSGEDEEDEAEVGNEKDDEDLVDEGNDVDEVDEGKEDGEEGAGAKVGVEGKDAKTGERDVEVGDVSGDFSSKLLILW